MTIAAASAVAYYQIERERRLERAMGKIVSSEYNGTDTKNSMVANANSENDGWTPRPGYLAKRKFVATPSGWFPVDDGFGAREFSWIFLFIYCLFVLLVMVASN